MTRDLQGSVGTDMDPVALDENQGREFLRVEPVPQQQFLPKERAALRRTESGGRRSWAIINRAAREQRLHIPSNTTTFFTSIAICTTQRPPKSGLRRETAPWSWREFAGGHFTHATETRGSLPRTISSPPVVLCHGALGVQVARRGRQVGEHKSRILLPASGARRNSGRRAPIRENLPR